ncbi:MAG TPA: ABC transporter ATP-binding protein, partial [Solirubrobacterales bacterium]|nr:ABC transporter ATP-binding protein [Solirubrobacterales bacterium]
MDSEAWRLPALKVEDLHKSFKIPANRVDSLKERVVRPFAAREYNELHALDGVSFEIGQGEFFGIVGRNGSGKSTLLKLLASIYRADSGTIRMAGRLAPFIELGVGFNEELTARENVVLNGVMMGLTPQETRSRLGAVLEFAELTEFVDLKLKNYSSGMLVRLAFSVMMQADADILLVDEVLAVGDAAFQQKCADAFHEMKAMGKTIVLVTHEMSTVEAYCHRAMLIDGGSIRYIGDPAEVGRRYLRLNFERGADATSGAAPEQSEAVRLVEAKLEGESGEELTNVEVGQRIRLAVEFEAVTESAGGYGVSFMVANADGIGVFEFGAGRVEKEDGSVGLAAGERFRVLAEIDNLLVPGRYSIHCGVNRIENNTVALYIHEAFDFVVFGSQSKLGIVRLPHEIKAEVESG